jgi:perosamine synthetase
MDSGWYTEASKTREFEKLFAEFIGAKYAVAVTSGMAALYVGVKALGIGPKDEIIVPDLTFVASPNSAEMAGAKPVLIDIEQTSLNLDISKLKNHLSKKTKAIMPVDFNGRSVKIDKLKEFADRNNLLLIEDACHAIGSFYGKFHTGTKSNIGVFSFSIPKIITTGQGGMIVTNDKNLYEKCLALKDFGRDMNAKKDMLKAFNHNSIGYNFKFTEFQAAIGVAQIKKLTLRMLKKKQMFKLYKELLSPIKEIEFIDTNLESTTPWMIDIILKTKKLRANLINYLIKKNIESRIFYPSIHSLKPYRHSDKKFPTSSNFSSRGLWLPSSISLSNEQIQLVCEEIRKFISQN